jgi:hypothetical protein
MCPYVVSLCVVPVPIFYYVIPLCGVPVSACLCVALGSPDI